MDIMDEKLTVDGEELSVLFSMSVLELHGGDALNYSPTPPLDQSRKLIIHPRGPHSAPAADVITTPALVPVDRLRFIDSEIHIIKIPGYRLTNGTGFN